MAEMVKTYNTKEVEPRIQALWEKLGVFRFDLKSKKPVYSIDTPPPTISGQLHVGHAFSYSQAEFIARFWRMRGYNVFYPMGFDNNGLATDLLTEKLKKVRAEDAGREKFGEFVMEVTREKEKEYTNVWKALGISVDWSLLYTTIDPAVQKLSQWSFIDLYKKSRAYRKEAPSLWCVKCKTAIAQAELEDKERESTFNDIEFKLAGAGKIVISTTRPELLPSCVSIFVNPSDEKNAGFIGKKVKVPIFGQEVRILADEKVDMEKGTGIVMCCTFGDQTDIEWYRQHNLPLKVSIDNRGRMTELAGKFAGLEVKEARRQIVEDLKKQGKLLGQKEITHAVNVHERCGTDIEFLVSKQWFVRYLDLKEKFVEMGGKIKWHPEHMKVRYDNWIRGLKWDWSISRQRFYGIPFPVWYCKKCEKEILASEKDLPVNPLVDKPSGKCECGSSEFEPEKDIMDTWTTSALTPMINSHWLEKKNLNDKILPMDLRPQAHDIITFWAFYTVAKSYLHRADIPFKNIMISGHGLDSRGDKMSKSKGNVVLPLDVVEKYSADALRWWAASANLGEDMPYQEKDVATGQKLLIKLWNSARLVQMFSGKNPKKPKNFRAVDLGLLNRLNKLIKSCTAHFEEFEYGKAKKEAEVFFWHTFCDYYLEMIKHRNDAGAKWTAYNILLTMIKLFAPIVPHVTEEIYQAMFKSEKSVHISSWPAAFDFGSEEDEKKLVMAEAVIGFLRKYKSGRKMAMNAELERVVLKTSENLDDILDDIKGTMKIKELVLKSGRGNDAEKIEGTDVWMEI